MGIKKTQQIKQAEEGGRKIQAKKAGVDAVGGRFGDRGDDTPKAQREGGG